MKRHHLIPSMYEVVTVLVGIALTVVGLFAFWVMAVAMGLA